MSARRDRKSSTSWWNRSRAFLVGFGVVAGASVGAFAAASATSESGGARHEANGQADRHETSEDLVFSAELIDDLAGTFAYELSHLDPDGDVSLTSNADGGYCIRLAVDEGDVGACGTEEVISTGLAYLLAGRPDGTYVLAGMVPDAVDTVELDGSPVAIDGNIWSTVLADDAPRTLRVGDSTSDTWVELAPARE